MSNMRAIVASVVLDQNATKPLDYSIPEEWQPILQIGMRVEVPFRSSVKQATVVALKNSSTFPNLKTILQLLGDAPSLSPTLWKLAEWMAAYYCAPLQKTLRCFIPPSARKDTVIQKKFRIVLHLTRNETAEWIIANRTKSGSAAAILILEKLLESTGGLTEAQLMEECEVSRSPLQTLLKRKWIRKEEIVEFDPSQEEFFPSRPKTLNDDQTNALSKINASLDGGQFAAHLIHGVTGSGKTEVYLQAIQMALSLGKSAILLVPEIALTSQTIERFRARFQEKIAIWHYQRSQGERTVAWNDLKQGKARVVIGARSALFCPVQNVGLIIVDEEHDTSYKQSEEAPCYQGRDVAVMRAHLEGATILLGSATPSIESRYNAEIGKYILSTLRNRATSAQMPTIQIIDMKQEFERAGGFTHFSAPLLEGLKKRCEAGEQSLIFLNRRGYHRNQTCSACGKTVKCPHCDLGLTFHKLNNHLSCHLCDFSREVPRSCPDCGSEQTLQFKGFGTEHVERTLHAILPGIRTLRMDRDTTRKKHDAEDLYRQFKAHKADVLIGTQMIAKGFHFPSVTLVGVLAADAALSIPDFRSGETVFQLITQVAGRAGRSELPGEVILQTFLPDHPLLHLAQKQDYDSFYAGELIERKMFLYPPFCRIIKITCFGLDEKETEKETQQLHLQIHQAGLPDIELMAVMPAAHAKVKDLFRFQFIIKAQKINPLKSILSSLLSKLRFKIDVDPISTFF